MSEEKLKECPDCGKTVSKRAATCPHCGAPLTVEAPEKRVDYASNMFGNHPDALFEDALIKCPSCGNKVSSNATFCPKCGRNFPKWEKTGIGSPAFCFIIGVIIFIIIVVLSMN